MHQGVWDDPNWTLRLQGPTVGHTFAKEEGSQSWKIQKIIWQRIKVEQGLVNVVVFGVTYTRYSATVHVFASGEKTARVYVRIVYLLPVACACVSSSICLLVWGFGWGVGGGVITSWKLQTFLCRCSLNVSCHVINFLLLTLAISLFTFSQCSCLPIACACVSSSICLLVWGFGWERWGGRNNVLEI